MIMSKKVLNDYLMCQEYGHLVKYLVHGISTKTQYDMVGIIFI